MKKLTVEKYDSLIIFQPDNLKQTARLDAIKRFCTETQ
jgi:hypothetical protein